MKVIIFPNLLKKDAYSCTLSVCEILSGLGAELLMDNRYRTEFCNVKSVKFGSFSALVHVADIAIAIGGDGTILKCAAKMIGCSTKLLGINTGRLGFMASVEKDNLNALSRLFTNEYKISERMLLTAEYTVDGEKKMYHALNDVVISGAYSKIIDFDVYVNSNLIGNYRADGVVFGTPTGSTAYSLSAGGPIIEPELECIEMNLICPHSLFARPMIYTDDKILSVVHNSPDDANICFSVDGNEAIPLKKGDRLIIRKSSHKINLIDMSGVTFYDALNKKLTRSLKGNL